MPTSSPAKKGRKSTSSSTDGQGPFDAIRSLEETEHKRLEKETSSVEREREEAQQSVARREKETMESRKAKMEQELEEYSTAQLHEAETTAKEASERDCSALEKGASSNQKTVVAELVQEACDPKTLFLA